MTTVSFVKATKSYEISLGTISRQTAYDSGILRQDYGIIRGLPIGSPIWVVHLPEQTEAGGPNYRIAAILVI